jgi:hypothetical protein
MVYAKEKSSMDTAASKKQVSIFGIVVARFRVPDDVQCPLSTSLYHMVDLYIP